MSRSVQIDYESLREAQARAQEADRIGPDPVPKSEVAGAQLAAAILTRRLRKCIAEGVHLGRPPDTPEHAKCPRCGQ